MLVCECVQTLTHHTNSLVIEHHRKNVKTFYDVPRRDEFSKGCGGICRCITLPKIYDF